jgi:hypothetical protein
LKIKISKNNKKSEIKKWDIGKLNKKEVKEETINNKCTEYSVRRSGRYE